MMQSCRLFRNEIHFAPAGFPDGRAIGFEMEEHDSALFQEEKLGQGVPPGTDFRLFKIHRDKGPGGDDIKTRKFQLGTIRLPIGGAINGPLVKGHDVLLNGRVLFDELDWKYDFPAGGASREIPDG